MKIWIPLFLCAASPAAMAIMRLPGYAEGSDLRITIEERAHAITDVIALIVSILAIIGILIGAGYFAIGQNHRGKRPRNSHEARNRRTKR